MMTASKSDATLIDRARSGEVSARHEILQRYRNQLRRMIAVRLDNRLSQRVDPSDVVQEALTEATQKLSDYLRERPVPIYVWLRQIAWERLVKLHQHHLGVQKRSVAREAKWSLSNESFMELAQVICRDSSPSQHLIKQEVRARVQSALENLSERDREILVLRFLEQLSGRETAEVLQITESAVKLRQLRALKRLRDLLGDDIVENPS